MYMLWNPENQSPGRGALVKQRAPITPGVQWIILNFAFELLCALLGLDSLVYFRETREVQIGKEALPRGGHENGTA